MTPLKGVTINTLQGNRAVMIDEENITPILINNEVGKGYGIFELAFATDKDEKTTAAEETKLTVQAQRY